LFRLCTLLRVCSSTTTPASGPGRPRGRLHNDTGEDACPERSDRNADAHLKRQIMGREVVVAVTNGRLDGFAVLTRTFGTWERILCQLDG
jgi:thiamine phosphate synthase YjbQ (UPF0047 family)